MSVLDQGLCDSESFLRRRVVGALTGPRPFGVRLRAYEELPPRLKLSSRRVNSIGKMNFVAGLAPISFSVTKYCRVMIFRFMPRDAP